MMREDFYIKVTRNKKSFDNYFGDPQKGPYSNRLKNNFGDRIEIMRGQETAWSGVIQSVANHPNAPADGCWSLDTGTFITTFFVEKSLFNCPVHGIGRGYDKLHQYIDEFTFDISGSGLRFLFHDDQGRGISGRGKRENGAFSEGCLIQPMPQYSEFNKRLVEMGVKPGDKAVLSIIEVDE